MYLADNIWEYLSLGHPESQSQTHLLAIKCPPTLRAGPFLVHLWSREDVRHRRRTVHLSDTRWGSNLSEGSLGCSGHSRTTRAPVAEREKFNASDEDERESSVPQHHGAPAPQCLLAAHHTAAQHRPALWPARCFKPCEAPSDRHVSSLQIRPSIKGCQELYKLFVFWRAAPVYDTDDAKQG